jgi:hypothetical protein
MQRKQFLGSARKFWSLSHSNIITQNVIITCQMPSSLMLYYLLYCEIKKKMFFKTKTLKKAYEISHLQDYSLFKLHKS